MSSVKENFLLTTPTSCHIWKDSKEDLLFKKFAKGMTDQMHLSMKLGHYVYVDL